MFIGPRGGGHPTPPRTRTTARRMTPSPPALTAAMGRTSRFQPRLRCRITQGDSPHDHHGHAATTDHSRASTGEEDTVVGEGPGRPLRRSCSWRGGLRRSRRLGSSSGATETRDTQVIRSITREEQVILVTAGITDVIEEPATGSTSSGCSSCPGASAPCSSATSSTRKFGIEGKDVKIAKTGDNAYRHLDPGVQVPRLRQPRLLGRQGGERPPELDDARDRQVRGRSRRCSPTRRSQTHIDGLPSCARRAGAHLLHEHHHEHRP